MRVQEYGKKVEKIADKLAGMIIGNEIDSIKYLDSYVHQEVSACFCSERDARINGSGEIVMEIIGNSERFPAGDVYMRLMGNGLIKKLQTIEVR